MVKQYEKSVIRINIGAQTKSNTLLIFSDNATL